MAKGRAALVTLVPGTRASGREDRARLWARLVAMILLVAVTAVWGSTFVVVKQALRQMPPFDFLGWRFGLATVLLLMIRIGALSRLDVRGLQRGVLLGLALGAGYVAQTVGLEHTPPALSGFLTGLFVVFTPLLSWLLLGRRAGPVVWVAVLLAFGGLALITVGGFTVSVGELLTVGCALCFGLHIVGLGEWSPGRDAYALTIVQLGTVGVLCLTISAASGTMAVPRGGEAWFAIAMTAILASALAYMVQTWAQSHLPPTQTAVILTMEPVFAAIFAVAFGGESLGLLTAVGGALVVAATYLVNTASASSQG